MTADNRMQQLDSLRAIAVGTVLLFHYHEASLVGRFIPIGDIGVRLFFVLSGFLITGILLRNGGQFGGLVAFYARRAIRLLPLYYAVIALMLLADPAVRDDWPYYLFHGVNVLLVVEQRWVNGTWFWSLAAEEQFYLLWPAAILMLSRRGLAMLCIALIVAAPLPVSAGWSLPARYSPASCCRSSPIPWPPEP